MGKQLYFKKIKKKFEKNKKTRGTFLVFLGRCRGASTLLSGKKEKRKKCHSASVQKASSPRSFTPAQKPVDDAISHIKTNCGWGLLVDIPTDIFCFFSTAVIAAGMACFNLFSYFFPFWVLEREPWSVQKVVKAKTKNK